jgi:hypothetical protein
MPRHAACRSCPTAQLATSEAGIEKNQARLSKSTLNSNDSSPAMADRATAVTPVQQIEALRQNVERNCWLERWLESDRWDASGHYYLAKVNRLTAQIMLIEAQIAQPAPSND